MPLFQSSSYVEICDFSNMLGVGILILKNSVQLTFQGESDSPDGAVAGSLQVSLDFTNIAKFHGVVKLKGSVLFTSATY